MKNIENKTSLLWLREKTLELTKRCLLGYERSMDQFYLDKAKWFGKMSQNLNDDINKL